MYVFTFVCNFSDVPTSESPTSTTEFSSGTTLGGVVEWAGLTALILLVYVYMRTYPYIGAE